LDAGWQRKICNELLQTMKKHRYPWVAAILTCLAMAGCQAALAQAASVAIASPQNEETLHDNNGNVAVQLTVGGDKPPGAQIVLLLDGNPVAGGGGTRFALTGVERGAHTLQAQLVDATGSPRASSAVVTFYMWQASRLSPLRKGHK
jgi:hypothetical protein